MNQMFNKAASAFLSGISSKCLALLSLTVPRVSFEAVPVSSCSHHMCTRQYFCTSIPKQTVCEAQHRLYLLFLQQVWTCNLGSALQGWARCCLDSWQRAEIGRLIWCRHWDWKWLYRRTKETSYESSLKWLFGECGCFSLNVSWHIKVTANFPQMKLAQALRLT